jgi:hypothetical protein
MTRWQRVGTLLKVNLLNVLRRYGGGASEADPLDS